jgi:hypothetical protein
LGIAVIAWCKRYCTCNPDEDVETVDREQVNLKFESIVKETTADFPYGGVRLIHTEADGGQPFRFNLVRAFASSGEERRIRICNLDYPWSCPGVYRPLLDPNILNGQSSLDDDPSLGTGAAKSGLSTSNCGLQCASRTECESPDPTCGRCKALVSDEDRHAAGLGPWLPNHRLISMCVAAVPFFLSDSKGGLGGRGLSEDWGCPCNRTYVSHACCSSGDGMIWERSELKLGALAMEEMWWT